MNTSNTFKNIFYNPTGPLNLTPHINSILADLLEESLAGSSSSRSGDIQDAILEAYHISLNSCSSATAAVVDGVDSTQSPISEAFILGQLALAQLVTTQHFEHKICSDMLSLLKDDKTAIFIKALYFGSLNNKKLAAEVNQSEENVSRRLKKLKQLGITSAKKIGTSMENFLANDVRALIDDIDLYGFNKQDSAGMSSDAKVVIEAKRNMLPTSMQNFSSFGTKKLRRYA